MNNKIIQNIQKIGLLRFQLENWLYQENILKMNKLHMPDFICIGAQKTGTTWLYENLKCHPEIKLNNTKELHYFDQQYLWKTLRWYSSNFDVEIGKITGDITPSYDALHPAMIGNMYKLMPNVKLIFGIRNPIDRAISHAIMELIKQKGKTENEINEEEMIVHFNSEVSLKYGDYVANINNYMKYYTNDSIYIYDFNDIAKQPKVLLRNIFKFLSIEQNIDWGLLPYNKVVAPNPQIDIPSICLAELAEIYCPKMDEYKNAFGLMAESWDCYC